MSGAWKKSFLLGLTLFALCLSAVLPALARADAVEDSALIAFRQIIPARESTETGELAVIGLAPSFLFVSEGNHLRQLVKVVVENRSGGPVAAAIQCRRPGNLVWEGNLTLKAGRQEVVAHVPDLREPAPLELVLSIGGREVVRQQYLWTPARQFTVYLTQLSHFDIGYTDTQARIMDLHNRYLDRVLEFYQATRDWPADAQFRWTADGGLAVQNYLREHPEREAVLREMTQNGHLEVNAKLAHLCSATAGPEMLAREVYWAKRDLESRFGVDCPTAIETDVPGLTWGNATILAGAGVKYFLHHPNLTGRGADVTRAYCFARAHYWLGPTGARLLTWHSRDSYVEGRFFIAGLDQTLRQFPELLLGWERDDYPYDIIHLTRSGLDPKTHFDDNSPPRFEICATVRAWNERFAYPHIKTATPRMFFEELERRYGDRIPSFSGDMPDWWSDGTLSDAKEEGISRDLHHRLAELELWASVGKLTLPGFEYPTEIINAAHLDNYLFDEHTWGHMLPFMPQEEQIWKVKRGDLLEGYVATADAASEALRRLAAAVACPGPGIVIFNPLGWTRSEPARVPLTRDQVDGEGRVTVALEDVLTGTKSPGQLDRGSGDDESPAAIFFLRDVPALGYRAFRFVPAAPVAADAFTIKSDLISNPFFALRFDRGQGGLVSLYDYRLQRELIDPLPGYALGQLIGRKQGPFDLYDVRTPAKVTGIAFAAGPVYATATVASTLATAPFTRVSAEFRLYRDAPWVDLAASLERYHCGIGANKYIAFPFRVPASEISLDLPFATMRPGLDQLPGYANFYAVSHWVRLASKSAGFGITWSTREGPIVEFTEMKKIASFMNTRLNRPGIYDNFIPSPVIYSEIMHNFENTNYHMQQNGSAVWHYRIATSATDPAPDVAVRSGWELAQPLIAVPTAASSGNLGPSASYVLLTPASVLLITLKRAEDGRGLILRLFESTGRETNAVLAFPSRPFSRATLTDVVERDQGPLPVSDGKLTFTLSPYDVKTIRVE